MKLFIIVLFSLLITNCSSNSPKPIAVNKEACEYCKMKISNLKFATQLITTKGRYYNFDDLACMIQYEKSNHIQVQSRFVTHYLNDKELLSFQKCFFIKGGKLASPMRGNFAAFSLQSDQKEYQKRFNASLLSTKQIYSSYK